MEKFSDINSNKPEAHFHIKIKPITMKFMFCRDENLNFMFRLLENENFATCNLKMWHLVSEKNCLQ